jgi:hypothetical protein
LDWQSKPQPANLTAMTTAAAIVESVGIAEARNERKPPIGKMGVQPR